MKNYHTIDRTTGIFKTNPKLTGDIRFIIDGRSVKMAKLQEIEEPAELYDIDISANLGVNLKKFRDRTQTENFYLVENETTQVTSVVEDYVDQYSTNYQWGLRRKREPNLVSFLAPIWLTKGEVPAYFAVYALPIEYNPSTDQYRNRTPNEILSQGKLVHFVNLKLHKIGELLRNHVDTLEFTNEPLNINQSLIRWSGISLEDGAFRTIQEPTLDRYQIEDSIFDSDEYLSTGWERNQLICPNLINLDFNFRTDQEPGAYQYFGIYSNDIQAFDVNRQNLELTAFQQMLATKNNVLVTLDRSAYKYQEALLQDNLTIQQQLGKIDRSAVQRPLQRGARILVAKVTGRMPIGAVLKLYQGNQEILAAYCSDRDDNNQFQYVKDIDLNYQKLADLLNRQFLDLDNLDFDAEYREASQELLIVCSSSANVDFRVELPIGLQSTTILTDAGRVRNPNISSDQVKFPAALDILDTVSILKSSITETIRRRLVETDNVILVYRNNVRVSTQVLEITEQNNTIFLKFADQLSIVPNDLPEILLQNASNAKLVELSYYGISVFSTDFFAEELYDQKEWEINRLFVETRNLVDSAVSGQLAEEYRDALDQYFRNLELETPAYYASINILTNEIVRTENPYDRLVEYDLQEYARRSILSPYVLKWGSTLGKMGAGNLPIINYNVAFGNNNFQPSRQLEQANNIDALQFSYFLIFTPPPTYFREFNDRYRAGYLAKTITLNELQTSSAARLDESFVHRITDAGGRTREIVTYQRITSDPSSAAGRVLFRGVVYRTDVSLVGKKFAVLLLNDDSAYQQPLIDLIVNDAANYAVLVIRTLLNDRFLSTLNRGFDHPQAFFDRHIFYADRAELRTSNSIDVTIPRTVNCKFGLTTNRIFQGQSVGIVRQYLNPATNQWNFAVNTFNNDDDFDFLGQLQIGQSYQIQTSLGAITFDRVTDIQNGYFWCRNVLLTPTVNLLGSFTANGPDFFETDPIVVQYRQVTSDSIYQLRVSNSNRDRYQPLKFSRLVNQIDAVELIETLDTDEMLIISDISAEEADLSHRISGTVAGFNIALSRRAALSTPIVYDLIRTFETENKMHTAFLANTTIREYGIIKVGNQSTLLYDDENRLLVHTQAGEVATDRIEFDPHKHIFRPNFYRFYTFRNNANLISGRVRPLDFPAIVSTGLRLAGLRTIRFVEVTDEQPFVEIQPINLLLQVLKQIDSYSGLTDITLSELLNRLLQIYSLQIDLLTVQQEQIDLALNPGTVNSPSLIRQFTTYRGLVEIRIRL